AVRFTFAALATTGRDIRFDLGRVEGYRNFCNKLWNASRYVVMNTTGEECGPNGEMEFSLADRWIRSRFGRTIETVIESFASYRLDLAARAIYEFTWNEFCDWYLELSKPILQSEDSSDAERLGTRRTLVEILEALLRLIHPVMPFISEEIWRKLAPLAHVDGVSVSTQAYPRTEAFPQDKAAEDELAWVRDFILGVRQIRGEMKIPPGKALPVLLRSASKQDRDRLERHGRFLTRLARLGAITVLESDVEPPPAATALLGEASIMVPLAGVIDVSAELARLRKKRDRLGVDLKRSESKLANDKFVANAPDDVVNREKQRVEEVRGAIAKIEQQLATMASLEGS
ncbi:MAG: class I tRNA ligase family protein, partial [Gammaproteobacteria bacterium]